MNILMVFTNCTPKKQTILGNYCYCNPVAVVVVLVVVAIV